MLNELWQPIKNYEDYFISNFGNVKHHNVILKPVKNNNGYLVVDLCKNGIRKQHLIHRLVALHYIPNINNLECVNHLNENKTDNCVSNLEWISRGDNTNYGTARKRGIETKINNNTLYKKSVYQLYNNEIISIYPSAKQASIETNINHGNIIQACKGKRKTAGNFTWKYAS